MNESERPELDSQELETIVHRLSLVPGVAGPKAREEALAIAVALRLRDNLKRYAADLNSEAFDAVARAIEELTQQGLLPNRPETLDRVISTGRALSDISQVPLTPEALAEALASKNQARAARIARQQGKRNIEDKEEAAKLSYRRAQLKIRAEAELQYIHEIGLVDVYRDTARAMRARFPDLELTLRDRRDSSTDFAIQMQWEFSGRLFSRSTGSSYFVGSGAVSEGSRADSLSTNFVGVHFGRRLDKNGNWKQWEVVQPERDTMTEALHGRIFEARRTTGGIPSLRRRVSTSLLLRK